MAHELHHAGDLGVSFVVDEQLAETIVSTELPHHVPCGATRLTALDKPEDCRKAFLSSVLRKARGRGRNKSEGTVEVSLLITDLRAGTSVRTVRAVRRSKASKSLGLFGSDFALVILARGGLTGGICGRCGR
jgi:hypothetical protein